MRNTLTLYLLLLCFTAPAFAQKHDYVWLFGYDNNGSVFPDFGGFNLDFKENPPSLYVQDRTLNFGNCCGAMSDSAGNLLFYTNGIAIHNSLHQLIENGDTINPGQYWESGQEDGYNNYFGAFALPAPGFPNRYYLFHTALKPPVLDPLDYQRKPFYYTVVDMDANNGAGKVIAKNQILLDKNVTWPAACKHGNGRDWWIVVGERHKPVQYVFLLSPAGISGPSVQEIGPPFSPAGEWVGKSLFSPDGNLYIRHDGNGYGGLRIFNFDRCSGVLYNLRILSYNLSFFSWYAAFSPDSRFLYLNYWDFVTRLDMQATDIGSSLDTIAYFNGGACPYPPFSHYFGVSQRAPDGKIYFATHPLSGKCLNIMHHPELPGISANIEPSAIGLPRWTAATMCPFPDYRLGEWENSPCDTINLQQHNSGFLSTFYAILPPSRQDAAFTLLPRIRSNAWRDKAEEEWRNLNPDIIIRDNDLKIKKRKGE